MTDQGTPRRPAAAPKAYDYRAFAELEIDTSTSLIRKIIGALVLAVAVVEAALFGWAAFGGSDYVVLKAHFSSWPSGLFWLSLLLLIGFLVAYPIRTPVEQRRRSRIRSTIIILACIFGLSALFVHFAGVFRYNPEIQAFSPSGQRRVAFVDVRTGTSVRVFTGTGLTARDAGSVGILCGLKISDRAGFQDENTLTISTPYNDYLIPLDPDTGAPLKHFGPTCGSPAQ